MRISNERESFRCLVKIFAVDAIVGQFQIKIFAFHKKL